MGAVRRGQEEEGGSDVALGGGVSRHWPAELLAMRDSQTGLFHLTHYDKSKVCFSRKENLFIDFQAQNWNGFLCTQEGPKRLLTRFWLGAVAGGEFCCLTKAEGECALFLPINLSSLPVFCETQQIPFTLLTENSSAIIIVWFCSSAKFAQKFWLWYLVTLANIFFQDKNYSKDALGMIFLLFM